MKFRIRIHETDGKHTYLVVADNGNMVVTNSPENYMGAKPGLTRWECEFDAVTAAKHVGAYMTRGDLVEHALPTYPGLLLHYNIKFEEVK